MTEGLTALNNPFVLVLITFITSTASAVIAFLLTKKKYNVEVRKTSSDITTNYEKIISDLRDDVQQWQDKESPADFFQ